MDPAIALYFRLQQMRPMPSSPLLEHPLILCIDDDDVALRVRKLLLGSAGYEVVTASTDEAGLEAFKQHPVDLVIADPFSK
jgi:CheY-like chemotaxis protein